MAVQIRVTADGVVVRFTGTDRVWACRRGVYLPLSRVLLARPMARRDAVTASPRVHLPGVSVPRVLRAGSYGVGERRQLWMVRGAERLLAIYLRGDPYHRIVVEVADPEATSQTINEALPPRRLPA
ncbi:hypothetical protein ACFPK1_26565 [Actinomycetospora rhizophila]|uniref:Uncharacterized protein n=1 Tax=Actinomycetospora rhizophila TaxID=1416876 RepID=A0ABV9ZNL5_9PSEU|nr:hypothetical protein [Actinomycetospora lutea]MDD7940998.1 hypothetical protein [Actinomycetospora lutea]